MLAENCLHKNTASIYQLQNKTQDEGTMRPKSMAYSINKGKTLKYNVTKTLGEYKFECNLNT